jgi:hypothetical protein
MRLSLRTLLAFEDHIFDQEQHQQLERLIPKHDAASTMLNRIRSTVRNPRLGVPGLVDQREELDPNLVAEYLDHQMPDEIQERFETYCLSSDKYLAEIASIHHVLSNVLGEPARTSRECRQRCYDLYRLPVFENVSSEKHEKEKTESDYPFGSRQLLFEDYLPSTQNTGTTGLKDFQKNQTPLNHTPLNHSPLNHSPLNHTQPAVSERPELTIFPQQNETGNQFPSFNLPQFSHLTSTLFPSQISSQTNNPVLSQTNDPATNNSATKTDNVISTPTDSTEQKKIQPFSLTAMFWNWLTTGRTEKNKTECKSENNTKNTETNTRKVISLWTLLMIFLLCLTGWLGWNKVQEKWNKVQPQTETAFRNTQSDVTGLTSGVSESPNGSENTTAVQPFPVAEIGVVKEKPVVPALLQEPPNKSVEITPFYAPVLPLSPQQLNEIPTQPILPNPNPNTNSNPNTNTVAKSTPNTLPPIPFAETVNTVNERNVKTETETNAAAEFQEQISGSAISAPSATTSTPTSSLPTATAVMLKPSETQLSEKLISEKSAGMLTEKPSEKPMSFAPNPMRHSQTVVSVPTTDNSEKQISSISSTDSITTQTVTEPAAKPAKRREKPEIRNSNTNTIARVTPTNFETPVRSKPLLVAMPEREPEQFDDQSLIAFQPISAPPKRKDITSLSPEFIEPKRQELAVHDLNEPEHPNAWITSVVNQAPAERPKERLMEQPSRRPIERQQVERQQIEPQIEQAEMTYSDGLTNSLPKPFPAFENTVKNTIGNTNPMESVTPTQRQHVIPVGEIRERFEVPQPRVLGRVLAVKEPCIVFSASTASDQWEMKRLPLALHADQYLLTTAPFRAVVELESGFLVEMVGDSKFCLLEPDESGISGIFIDYGRLVIRPIAAQNRGTTQSLRLQTEKVHGTVHLTDSKSLVFVDTFAEILENTSGESVPNRHALPQTRPILGLIPDGNGKISWQVDQVSLTTTKQAGILLIAEKPELGNIQGLPNWLNPLPLPPESEQLATVCHQIFDKTAGNCEAALNLLIREPSIVVRSFGYRLWGDLGRFDIPLTFLSEAKPDEEPIRQVLVPYFREVMKRDEETVQRLADAIETVRH